MNLKPIFLLGLLSITANLPTPSFAADTLIKPGSTTNPAAAKNMYLQTPDNHLIPASVVYTTDGNGNLVPVSSSISNINIGTVNQGTNNDGSSPWHVIDDQALTKWNLFLPKFDVNLSTLASQVTLQSVLGKLDVNLSTVAKDATLNNLSNNVVHADTGNVTIISSTLPTGAATASKQDTAQTTLNSLDSKTPTLGQKAMAGSRSIVIASDQSAIGVKNQDGSGNPLGSTSGALNVSVVNTSLAIQGGNSTAVKVDGSAVTQPVSMVSVPLAAGAATETTLSTLNGKVSITSNGIKTDGSAIIQPVSGTITANAGSGTFAVAGTVNSKLQDGNGNIISSQMSGFQRALDVGVNVSGVQVDPRQVRTLTTTDIVTASNVTGNVGSGTIDLGNPVKVAGKYNSSAIALTDGQRGDLQLDTAGSLVITQKLRFLNFVTAGTTVIKTGIGKLSSVCLNSIGGTSGSLILYDNTAGSGTRFGLYTPQTGFNTYFAPQCQEIGGAVFSTGLTAVVTGNSDWTIYYQ
jgi:hypothetical protein